MDRNKQAISDALEIINNKSNLGSRFNSGKLQWSLLHFNSIKNMVKVLEFGAKKYSRDNWKKGLVKEEILESTMRHLISIFEGEDIDLESGLPHTSHVMCNMMFYDYHYGRDLEENKGK